MARAKKETAPEESPSAPLWMVTFSDCMNLLLTFFVLLVTFSSFGDESQSKLPTLGAALRNAFGPPSETGGAGDKGSIIPQHQIWSVRQPEFGSDKPAGNPLSQARPGVLKDDVQMPDYRNHKVFLIASGKVFLGKGIVLSAEGRYLLAVLAAFLKEMSGQVVVSENAAEGQEEDLEIGLSRAMAVVEFFAQAQGLDARRFSISADTTLHLEGAGTGAQRGRGHERTLEIVLLDRSVRR